MTMTNEELESCIKEMHELLAAYKLAVFDFAKLAATTSSNLQGLAEKTHTGLKYLSDHLIDMNKRLGELENAKTTDN